MRWIYTCAALTVLCLVALAAPGHAGDPADCVAFRYNGSVVKRVQATLKEWGYDPGPADGKEGPQTAAAVQMFQMHMGIESTGRLSAATLEMLFGSLDAISGVKVTKNPKGWPENVYAATCH